MGISFNNIPASSIQLDDPRNGKWTADVVFAGPNAPKVDTIGELKIDSISWIGYVYSSTNISANIYKLRIKGGIHLAKNNTVNTYELQLCSSTPTTVIEVLEKILSFTDDVLGDVSETIAGTVYPGYQILGNENPYSQLDKLISTFDNHVWRVGADSGFINIYGDDGLTLSVFPTNYSPSNTSFNGSKTYKCVTLDKYPEPGSLHPDGWKVEQTSIYKDAKTTSITLYKRTVKQLLSTNINTSKPVYSNVYKCSVSNQNTDGTLNLNVDNEYVSILGNSLINVPYQTVPGLTLQVLPNTKCTVAFHGGDPQYPYIMSFIGQDSGTYTHVLGSESNAQYVALSNKVDEEIQRIWTHLTSTFVVLAQDGGATMQTNAITAANAALLQVKSVTCNKLKVE